MADGTSGTTQREPSTPADATPKSNKRKWFRRLRKYLAVLLLLAVIVGRLTMAYFVREYVNHVLNSGQIFAGRIGGVSIHLWRGAYAIDQVRLVKTTGDVPVPLFAAKRVELELEWKALLHGHVVGRVRMDSPELNFVDAPSDAESQTGAGGPWLSILSDLFPFKINSVQISDGSVHFRTYRSAQPVDVFLSQMTATVDNLTNVRNETTPLLTTVTADGKAMDQADFEFRMRLNPFSYLPSFTMRMKLLGLEVTKVNDLARTYGGFDFQKGLFDLIVEADAKSGQIQGYVLPLFLNLQVFDLSDLKKDDPLNAFWEALVGATMEILKNQKRNQFGTQIPFSASLENPRPDVLAAIGNVLRNAFIRAYLPRFSAVSQDGSQLHFGPPKITDSISVGDE